MFASLGLFAGVFSFLFAYIVLIWDDVDVWYLAGADGLVVWGRCGFGY